MIEIGQGKLDNAEKLLPHVYNELHALADSLFRHQKPGHTLQPTALVHEAFIKLVDRNRTPWQSRSHFFAVAAKAMRQILVDHARKNRAEKRGDGWNRIALDEHLCPTSQNEIDMYDLDTALTKLSQLDKRQSDLVELRFFGGLGVVEAAELIGISKRTAELDWRMARAWLRNELSSE